MITGRGLRIGDLACRNGFYCPGHTAALETALPEIMEEQAKQSTEENSEAREEAHAPTLPKTLALLCPMREQSRTSNQALNDGQESKQNAQREHHDSW